MYSLTATYFLSLFWTSSPSRMAPIPVRATPAMAMGPESLACPIWAAIPRTLEATFVTLTTSGLATKSWVLLRAFFRNGCMVHHPDGISDCRQLIVRGAQGVLQAVSRGAVESPLMTPS